MMEASGIRLEPHVRPIDPVGYLDMVALTASALGPHGFRRPAEGSLLGGRALPHDPR